MRTAPPNDGLLRMSADEPTTLDSATRVSGRPGRDELARTLVMTLLLHPEGRLGEQAVLDDLAPGVPRELSRNRPSFSGPRGAHPLDHARVSRRPVWFILSDAELLIRAGAEPARVRIDGEPLVGTARIPLTRLSEAGVALELGGAVLVWLSWNRPTRLPAEDHQIVGLSPQAVDIRREIDGAARSTAPVLVRGESGVGKELVARAVHRASQRAEGPWVAVNMAAVPQSMAASELFGHGRGAFTGAVQSRRGWFEQAHRGTLFLDEIGETPLDVQPQLLRALDEGEIQPVGQATRRVDVRLISATDADLEQLVAARRFRSALLHRLSGVTITVPPLRARRMDIPVLLQHFLADELKRYGAEALLTSSAAWLRADLIARLMAWHFPGNVRELRHLAQQIAATSHDQPVATLPTGLLERLERDDDASSAGPGQRHGSGHARARPTGGLSDAQVRQALQENDWVVVRAAAALGVARNTLLEAMARLPDLRQARDLEPGEIERALEMADGEVETAARTLRVSAHGLRLRMNALGWPTPR